MAPTKQRPSARTKVPPIHRFRDDFDRLLTANSSLFSPTPPSLVTTRDERKNDRSDVSGMSVFGTLATGASSAASHKTVGVNKGETAPHRSKRTKPKKPASYGLFSSLLYEDRPKGVKKKRCKPKNPKPSKELLEYRDKINTLFGPPASGSSSDAICTTSHATNIPLFCSTPIARKSSGRISRCRGGSRSDLVADVSSIGCGREEELAVTGDGGEVGLPAPLLSSTSSIVRFETPPKVTGVFLCRTNESELSPCESPVAARTQRSDMFFSAADIRDSAVGGSNVDNSASSGGVFKLDNGGATTRSAMTSEPTENSCSFSEGSFVVKQRPHRRYVNNVNDFTGLHLSDGVDTGSCEKSGLEAHIIDDERDVSTDGQTANQSAERSGEIKEVTPDHKVELVHNKSSNSATQQSPNEADEEVAEGDKRLSCGRHVDDSVDLSDVLSPTGQSRSAEASSIGLDSLNFTGLRLSDDVDTGSCEKSDLEAHSTDWESIDDEPEVSSDCKSANQTTERSEEFDEQTPDQGHPKESDDVPQEDIAEEESCNVETVDVSQHSSDISFERQQMSLSHLERDTLCNIIGVSSASFGGFRTPAISATSSRSSSTSSPADENDSEEISIDVSELELQISGNNHSKLSRGSVSPSVSFSSGDSEKSSSSPEASHSEDDATIVLQNKYRDMTPVRYNTLYDIPENQEHSNRNNIVSPRRTGPITRRSTRAKEEKAPGKLLSSRPSAVGVPDLNVLVEEDAASETTSTQSELNSGGGEDRVPSFLGLENLMLCPGKKYRKSLAIIRLLTDEESTSTVDDITILAPERGRHFSQSVEEVIRLQTYGQHEEGGVNRLPPVLDVRRRLSIRRSSLMKQCTPPSKRRPTFYSTPTGSLSFFSRASTTFSLSSPVASSSLRDETLLASTETAEQVAYKDIVFGVCNQTQPCGFNDILDESAFEDATKVGEGVYGEVFFVNRGPRKNVLKIIPIEGDMLVNGERQKRYEEIYTELLVTRELHSLSESDECYGFAELVSSSIVRGRYPQKFIDMWLTFDQVRGSDNENPCKFGDNQLYLILELGNGGMALEDYSFSTARQTLSIFKQVVMSLAVAERKFDFEHRDLHWGNILVSRITERSVNYVLDGRSYSLQTNCVKATIIDYTLSRMTHMQQPIYNDIGKDPEMFVAVGDYQFDIYRHMKKDVGNEWWRFIPKTNVRWLHYVIDKMINTVKYQRRTAKIHGDSMRELNSINKWLLACDSSYDVAMRLFK